MERQPLTLDDANAFAAEFLKETGGLRIENQEMKRKREASIQIQP